MKKIFIVLLLLLLLCGCSKEKNKEVNIYKIDTNEIFTVKNLAYNPGLNYIENCIIEINNDTNYTYEAYTEQESCGYFYNKYGEENKSIENVNSKYISYLVNTDSKSFSKPYYWMVVIQKQENNIIGAICCFLTIIEHKFVVAGEDYFIMEAFQYSFPKIDNEYQDVSLDYIFNQIDSSILNRIEKAILDEEYIPNKLIDYYLEKIKNDKKAMLRYENKLLELKLKNNEYILKNYKDIDDLIKANNDLLDVFNKVEKVATESIYSSYISDSSKGKSDYGFFFHEDDKCYYFLRKLFLTKNSIRDTEKILIVLNPNKEVIGDKVDYIDDLGLAIYKVKKTEFTKLNYTPNVLKISNWQAEKEIVFHCGVMDKNGFNFTSIGVIKNINGKVKLGSSYNEEYYYGLEVSTSNLSFNYSYPILNKDLEVCGFRMPFSSQSSDYPTDICARGEDIVRWLNYNFYEELR